MKRYAPKIPGALVALVLLTTLVALLDLPAKGVAVLGNAIPSGLPTLTLPTIPLADYLRLLPGALAIVAILLCEGLLVVRSYSNKYGYKADGDQMLFAYGAANLAAGFTGSLVTGNSPSRSAAMDAAGARSQLPSLVAAGTITLVMLFFTNLLAYLPNAALAGIVANAVLSLIEVHEFRELWRMRRSEFWIAAVCLLSVLALGPLRAVMIAFLLSTIDVIRRASRPDTAALVEAPDGSHFLPAADGKASGSSGLVVYRFGAPLYFANATLFLDDVERLVTQAPTPVRWFVLDAQAMVDVDTTGAGVLRQAITLLKKRNITFAVSRADRSFRSWLERYDLMELIDPGRFYPTNRHAAQAFRQSPEGKAAGRMRAGMETMMKAPDAVPGPKPGAAATLEMRCNHTRGCMNWLQRYSLRHYFRNSIWILPVAGMVAALLAVQGLHWIETRFGWQAGFDPAATMAMFGTLAGSMFTFIVFLSSSPAAGAAAGQRRSSARGSSGSCSGSR